DERDAQVRIRIYERDSLSGIPGKDLLRKSYIVTVKPNQKNIKVDISEENTPFLPDGVFIGIDVLVYVNNSGTLVSYHIKTVARLQCV
ncbi:MAG: hypothetical protein L3J59_16610, partial [Methylococcaceae bacterium]|nr:hypothetical protein [Methylococcaceae bacterium]